MIVKVTRNGRVTLVQGTHLGPEPGGVGLRLRRGSGPNGETIAYIHPERDQIEILPDVVPVDTHYPTELM